MNETTTASDPVAEAWEKLPPALQRYLENMPLKPCRALHRRRIRVNAKALARRKARRAREVGARARPAR